MFWMGTLHFALGFAFHQSSTLVKSLFPGLGTDCSHLLYKAITAASLKSVKSGGSDRTALKITKQYCVCLFPRRMKELISTGPFSIVWLQQASMLYYALYVFCNPSYFCVSNLLFLILLHQPPFTSMAVLLLLHRYSCTPPIIIAFCP